VLQELVDLLHPLAKATDLTQGEQVVIISAVVPTILSLRRFLLEALPIVRFHSAAVQEWLNQLHERFFFLYSRLDIPVAGRHTTRTLAFDTVMFMMAAALDPKYGFRWLQDHPGKQEVKDALRHRIAG